MLTILYILIGAAIGCVISWAIETKTGTPTTISICALGGLVGGITSQFVVPLSALIFGILGAIIGAVLLMWVFSTAAR